MAQTVGPCTSSKDAWLGAGYTVLRSPCEDLSSVCPQCRERRGDLGRPGPWEHRPCEPVAVLSFVSNVLIVTDYTLLSSPDICCTAGLISVLPNEKVTLINAV